MRTGFAIALVGLLPGAAFAADSGPYVGAGAGMYYAKADLGGGGSDFDDSAGLFRLYGGYDINKYVSLQADYIAYGDTEDSILGTKVKLENGYSWELSVRPTYPIPPQVSQTTSGCFGSMGWVGGR